MPPAMSPKPQGELATTRAPQYGQLADMGRLSTVLGSVIRFKAPPTHNWHDIHPMELRNYRASAGAFASQSAQRLPVCAMCVQLTRTYRNGGNRIANNWRLI